MHCHVYFSGNIKMEDESQVEESSCENRKSESQRRTCFICGSVLHRAGYYRHLKMVHKYTDEECNKIKEERKESEAATIICPLCENREASHEAFARHCAIEHAENGADGRPQNYDVFEQDFLNEEQYQQWLEKECEKNCTTFHQRSVKRVGNQTKRQRLW